MRVEQMPNDHAAVLTKRRNKTGQRMRDHRLYQHNRLTMNDSSIRLANCQLVVPGVRRPKPRAEADQTTRCWCRGVRWTASSTEWCRYRSARKCGKRRRTRRAKEAFACGSV